MATSKSRKALEQLIQREVTSMFESVLDYTQVAVPDTDRFKVLRGKILRAGNDCIRSINARLNDYDVKYIGALGEDVIEVCRKQG